jgi:hypothetical protein
MDAQVQKRKSKHVSRKIILISLVTFILLMSAVATQLLYAVISSDRVYAGVQVSDIQAGGLTAAELKESIERKYADKVNSITLTLHAKILV